MTPAQQAAAKPMSEADALAIRDGGLACGSCNRTFGHPMALRDHMRRAHTDFTALERYSVDPAFRDQIDAEVAANRARMNAAIDAGMAKYDAKRLARIAAREARS